MLTETSTATSQVTYTYDTAGRLATAQRVNGAVTTTQTRSYDPMFRLIGVTNTGGSTTSTIIDWDPTNMVAQLAGITTAGATADVLSGPAGLPAVRVGAVHSAVGQDIYGSALPTTATANLARASSYSQFGTPGGANTFEPRIGYRSELTVDNLLHLRARNYQPTLGRFTTTDPTPGRSGKTTLANQYHYTDNSPLQTVDPLGLFSIGESDAGGTGIGGLFDQFAGVSVGVLPVVVVASPHLVPLFLAGAAVIAIFAKEIVQAVVWLVTGLVKGIAWVVEKLVDAVAWAIEAGLPAAVWGAETVYNTAIWGAETVLDGVDAAGNATGEVIDWVSGGDLSEIAEQVVKVPTAPPVTKAPDSNKPNDRPKPAPVPLPNADGARDGGGKDCATNTAGADYLRKESQIAARFGTTVRAVKDAIHAAKTNLPKGGPIRNPDVAVDPDTGEIYPDIDGCLGDSIGNLWDLLGGD
jgi:RHS repeat-associated protein